MLANERKSIAKSLESNFETVDLEGDDDGS